MVQIAGKYELVKNEKLVEHLVALGIPEDKAKAGDALKPKLEVIVDGKNVTINSDSGVLNTTTIYILGQEIEETLPLGFTVKSTASLSGDTLTISSKAEAEKKSGDRVYKFSDTELVMTSTSGDSKVPTAKRFYKRV